MASSTNVYMTSMMNVMNDMKRDNITEVINALELKSLMTDDIKSVLMEMLTSVKINKKIKKEKKPRFSGYHLFMKEQRAVVKAEHPDIKPQELTSVVSKAWKDISDEKKEEFNARALKLKNEYNASAEKSDNEETTINETTDDEKKPSDEKKTTKKTSEKKPKKTTEKKKQPKKSKTPPSSDDEDENIQIENADSDIDL